MDLISDYVNTMMQIVDAPRIFIEASAYHFISSTLGKYIICPYIPRALDNPFKPNLWVMISGAPSRSRKSTLIGYERSMLSNAFITYFKLKNPNLLEDDIRKHVMQMFLQTGSPEGISDHISDNQDLYDEFILISAEWGGVLRQMRGAKTYMEGLINLLSSLYSSEDIVWHGAKKTRYIKRGLYVTAIVGLQEPRLYIDRYLLEQGLMRRFLLVYATPKDFERWIPPLDMSREAKFYNLKSIYEVVGGLMKEYDNKKPVSITMTNAVRNFINNYARQVEDKILEDPSSPWSLYVQSLWEHMTKLAILSAAGRKTPQPTGELGYMLSVDMTDVQYAYNYIKRIEPNAMMAIASIGAPEIEAPYVNYSSILDRIYSIIVDAGRDGIEFTELLSRTRLLKKDLVEYLKNLIDEGRIEAYYFQPRRKKPTVLLVSSTYKLQYSDRIIKSKPIPSNALPMFL